jgi:hypothetical protein
VTAQVAEGLAKYAGVYFDWAADSAAYFFHLDHPVSPTTAGEWQMPDHFSRSLDQRKLRRRTRGRCRSAVRVRIRRVCEEAKLGKASWVASGKSTLRGPDRVGVDRKVDFQT